MRGMRRKTRAELGGNTWRFLSFFDTPLACVIIMNVMIVMLMIVMLMIVMLMIVMVVLMLMVMVMVNC